MVTVTAHVDLAGVLRERLAAYLSPATVAAFGAPAGSPVVAVPVSVVGETLGCVLLVMDKPRPLDAEIQQLLSVLSAAIGFALLRDRLVEGTRSAKG
jgi:hypothetical protein